MGVFLMKREDFDEDDIQGMLIAYLDEQMEPDERNEFEKLLDAHEDLRADLELYRKTSVNIGNLFELESTKTPAHILADFHQRDFGEPRKGNVISILSRKKVVKQFFSFQGVTQMAAALVLGVFLGPLIYENLPNQDTDLFKQPLQFRGLNTGSESNQFKKPAIKIGSENLIEKSQILDLQLRNGFNIVTSEKPAEDFVLTKPFQFLFFSPDAGELIIFLKKTSKDGLETEEKLFQGEVNSGIQLIFPAEGSFTTTGLRQIDLTAELTKGLNDRITYSQKYKIE